MGYSAEIQKADKICAVVKLSGPFSNYQSLSTSSRMHRKFGGAASQSDSLHELDCRLLTI